MWAFSKPFEVALQRMMQLSVRMSALSSEVVSAAVGLGQSGKVAAAVFESEKVAGFELDIQCTEVAVAEAASSAVVLALDSQCIVAVMSSPGNRWVGTQSHSIAAVAGLAGKRRAAHTVEDRGEHYLPRPNMKLSSNTCCPHLLTGGHYKTIEIYRDGSSS